VRFALDPSADLVIVDRVQIQQVLLNLIRNAMDAMQDGGTRDLAISASTLDEDHVQVTVSDTGAGIDPDVAVQLFQPFITTKRAGMGVGLSISRTIMEAHGGRLWFEANAAGGADFHFTLHRARLEEELA
jgi:two-component system sensor kinase FixL